jgi:transketolase
LGEDGPTHQPVEHLASLRAIPNLNVYRPCDAVETAECWAMALKTEKTPSVLALTRQGLPTLRTQAGDGDSPCARGGYILCEAETTARQITLLASGSEVEIAVAARNALEEEGIGAAVISIPCMDLFLAQDVAYRSHVLGETPRIAVEAGIRQGWDALLGPQGAFIGMTGFGASAPAKDLFAHFGITAEAVISAAKARI